jgi:5-methylthioadenosine/S-adenosylhomocysteine deaminase
MYRVAKAPSPLILPPVPVIIAMGARPNRLNEVTAMILIDDVRLCTAETGLAIERAAVAVADGRIAAVLRGEDDRLAACARAAEVVASDGMILMPGLINAHTHSYGNVLRGTENSLPLEPWALYTVAYCRSLDDEAIRLAVLIGAAEMIRNGITACVDHFSQIGRALAALAAHRESGMRVGFAPMMQDIPDHRVLALDMPPDLLRRLEAVAPPTPAEVERFFRNLAAESDGGRVAIMLGPNAPQRCSPALLDLWRRLADELDLNVHTHCLETWPQAEAGRRNAAGSTVGEMARLGLLDRRLSIAHGIWLDPAERDLLAEHRVAVVHNPTSNMMLGSGVMPLDDYRRRGVTLALGSDSANTGGRNDLFEIMRLAMMMHRPALPSQDWPRPEQVLTMATLGGARVLGLEHELGRIAPGQRADLILLRSGGAAMIAARPGIATIVQHGSADAVSAVMIDGRWVYRDGRILSFDEQGVLDRYAAIGGEILDRAAHELELADTARPYFERPYRDRQAEHRG